jgi:[acyl-carrier-protein] S-malonyltransferase
MSETANTIVLCPGQGAQIVGMGKAWADKHPIAAATFAAAEEVLDFGLSDVAFNGPVEQLNRTDIAQAAIFVTSIACFRVLAEQGKTGKIVATAGLSLGEFTALHLAGAFDFETGLKLVRLRGQAMQDAAEKSSGGMVALIGGDEAQANAVCEKALAAAPSGSVLVPANFNCPGQIVLSGSADACALALKAAEEVGVRAQPLAVAGAFHSSLMQPAADRLAAALDQASWAMPGVPVMSNMTGQPHNVGDIASIKKLLVQQLTSPVRWEQDVKWLIGNVQGRFIEPAPGKSLSGMMRRIDKAVKVENFAEPA